MRPPPLDSPLMLPTQQGLLATRQWDQLQSHQQPNRNHVRGLHWTVVSSFAVDTTQTSKYNLKITVLVPMSIRQLLV